MIIDSKNSSFFQTNDGDTSGTIWSSRNLDLITDPGKISPSEKFLVTSRSTDAGTAPQGLPVSFTRARVAISGIGTDYYWICLAGTQIYLSSTLNGAWAADVTASSPTTLNPIYDDIKAFNYNAFYVTKGANLLKRSATAWSTISTALDAYNFIRLLEVYNKRLYVLQNTAIYSLSSSDILATSSTNTFTLDSAISNFQNFTAMRAVSNGLWLAVSSSDGSSSRMIFWDGTTANTADVNIEITGRPVILGISILHNVPYILTNDLCLSRYNGSFFEEVAKFDSDDTVLYQATNNADHARFIHPNGMQTVGDEILFNISNRPADATELLPQRIPSGIHAYNEKHGLYLKQALTKDGANTIDNKDMAQVYIPRAGAIFPVSDSLTLTPSNPSVDTTEMSDFLVGFSYQSDNSTEVYAIGLNDKKSARQPTANTAGVLITPQYLAEEVQENWQKFYTFIKPMVNSTDKIVVKYRKQEYTPVESSITWVDTTSFTSTDADWATIKTNFEAGVDYEIEGLQGDGAGYLSHVTNITVNAGTYTVTLDETITGMTTNTAKVRVDRWNKIGEFTDDSEVEAFKEFNPETVSTWIQFKIYMIGVDIQLQRILSKSSVEQEI